MILSPLRPFHWTVNRFTDLAPVLGRGRADLSWAPGTGGGGGVDRADYDSSHQNTLMYIKWLPVSRLLWQPTILVLHLLYLWEPGQTLASHQQYPSKDTDWIVLLFIWQIFNYLTGNHTLLHHAYKSPLTNHPSLWSHKFLDFSFMARNVSVPLGSIKVTQIEYIHCKHALAIYLMLDNHYTKRLKGVYSDTRLGCMNQL